MMPGQKCVAKIIDMRHPLMVMQESAMRKRHFASGYDGVPQKGAELFPMQIAMTPVEGTAFAACAFIGKVASWAC
jgi:hypothetical protein